MIRQGPLNPHLLSLLARIRHTNTLVIADWAFPFWPKIETVDLAVVTGLPTVPQLLQAILPNFQVGAAFMASEFLTTNAEESSRPLLNALGGIPITYEAHPVFKRRVPGAIGLIRTGDSTPYSNLILESA